MPSVKKPKFDWDAHWAERSEQPIPVKAGGRVWEVTPNIPASIVLDFIAITGMGDDAEAASKVMDRDHLRRFFDATFGAEAFPVLVETLTMTQMTDLMGYVMNNFVSPLEQPVADDGALPLLGAASTPSITGDSSKPTSSENTISTSGDPSTTA